jgi:serine/threonine protein kinase
LDVSLTLNEQPGDRIGRYKLLQQIGEGGCGVVYMAEQREPVRRRVALKVIKLGMDTREVIARFEAERQALALMDHPNISKVLDAGATDAGRPYFVMELVQGIPITHYCDKNKLNTKERLELFVQVCHAIQHAHQKGIIHRDIKPSNILVADQEGVPEPKIIDFGIAKATAGQKLTDKTVFTALEQFIGTPAYMSPEQAKLSGLDIDTRSDIYSLGVLLYELLTGRTPFDARRLLEVGFDEIRRIIREEEPPSPSKRLSTMADEEQTTAARARQTDSPRLLHLIRGDLDWIVMKCLDKDRNRRYETANALASDIMRHVNNEPVLARPPSKVYRFQKLVRRHKLAFAAAAAVGLTLLISLGVVVSALQTSRESERAAKGALLRAQTAESADLAEAKKAKSEAERAETAETLAKQRLAESEAISKFLTQLFQSPDPARDGRTIKVVDILSAAARKLETELTNQPSLQAKLQATLGLTYDALGLSREAIPLQEKVRDYYLAASGPEHPDTLGAMNELANFYDDAGRRDEALKLREEVLALRRTVNGPEDPATLIAMNNLANSYFEAGRRDEALKMREEVLALRRTVSGPEHTDTLKAMNNLGDSYEAVGRREEALKLREEVLPLRRKVSGPEHPETLRAMHNLANSYDEAGRRDEALKLREEALALSRKLNRPESPDTLGAMNNLAYSYHEAGRRDEAIMLMEEVLALCRKVNGLEHPNTLDAMQNLASSYDDAGRRVQALKMRELVLALRRKVLGPEHADTLTTMSDLATSYDESARRDEALKLREEALPLFRKVLGPENPYTLQAMNDLASSYAEAGRHQEAIALLAKACEADPKDTDGSLTLATWQTWFSHDADYEATRRRLVQQAEGTDQAGTAERAAKAASLRPSTDAVLLTNALHLAQRAVELGTNSSSLPWYQLSLGLAEYRNGQFAAAERSIVVAEQTVGDQDEIQGIAHMFHAMSLFRQNRPEEARKLFTQAETQMLPLPKDENKPSVDGRTLDHDLLIWWLAYKEAKSMLSESAAKP